MRTGLPPIVGPNLNQDVFSLPTDVGTTTFPQVFHRGYIESYNFTIQHDAGAGFNVQAAYVGSRAIRQTVIQNINSAGPGGGNNGRALFPSFGRIANVNYFTPFDTASYNGMQLQVNRRVKGAMLGVSYTLSRAIDYADDQDSGLTWNWVPMLYRNKAVAGFDRTHNFQFFGNYGLPFGKGQRWAQSGLVSRLAGGWQLNWILSRYSGTPFNVVTSGTSVNAPGSTQTADQVLANVQILGGHGSGDPYFDPNAFAPVTAVRFGNSGRNIVRGPGFFNLDGSVFRDFSITERFVLRISCRSVRPHQHAAIREPGRNRFFSDAERQRIHQSSERLRRDYECDGRTPIPVWAEAFFLIRSEISQPLAQKADCDLRRMKSAARVNQRFAHIRRGH